MGSGAQLPTALAIHRTMCTGDAGQIRACIRPHPRLTCVARESPRYLFMFVVVPMAAQGLIALQHRYQPSHRCLRINKPRIVCHVCLHPACSVHHKDISRAGLRSRCIFSHCVHSTLHGVSAALPQLHQACLLVVCACTVTYSSAPDSQQGPRISCAIAGSQAGQYLGARAPQ